MEFLLIKKMGEKNVSTYIFVDEFYKLVFLSAKGMFQWEASIGIHNNWLLIDSFN